MKKNTGDSKELKAENKAWSACFKAQEVKPYDPMKHFKARLDYAVAKANFIGSNKI
jgi:hypothetical protein